MSDRYQFSLTDDSVYQYVMDLVEKFAVLSGGVVVDVGCGYGAIAEAVLELGMTYIGCDVDPRSLANLAERGFETEMIDLDSPERTVASIEKRLGDRPLAALIMIDALEHITNGPEVLVAFSGLGIRHGSVPLILAVPNVTHFDLAAKLLLGRWDMTETGLLDDTHVSFFSEDRLRAMTIGSGWVEIGSNDFPLRISDQHFPADAPVLQDGSPLHDLLLEVRERSSGAAIVNEFVRAYAPLGSTGSPEAGDSSTPVPFVSVLMRTQGTRPATLQESLLSMAAQTDQDFEILLLAHNVPREMLTHLRYLADVFGADFGRRVSVVPVDGGGRTRPLTVGIERAVGEYVAILDDDDVVFGHWVETFKALAKKHPGQVLRSPVAEQDVEPIRWGGDRPGYDVVGRPRCRWPEPFDVLDHLWENHSPPCGWAVPRSIFSEQGIRFDESLPVLEDWDVLMQAVLWCGVADTGEITALWRRWRVGDSSTSVHSENEWKQARSAITAKFDAKPLLLPPQAMSAIQADRTRLEIYRSESERLQRELEAWQRHGAHLEAALETAQHEVEIMRRSTSWKVSKPIRVLGSQVRNLMRGPGSDGADT